MDDDRTRTRADRRPLVAAVAVVALVLAVGAWLLADGVGGGGDQERAPATTQLTPSTLDAEQRAEAELIECIGGLSPDPSATVPPATDCVGAGPPPSGPAPGGTAATTPAAGGPGG